MHSFLLDLKEKSCLLFFYAGCRFPDEHERLRNPDEGKKRRCFILRGMIFIIFFFLGLTWREERHQRAQKMKVSWAHAGKRRALIREIPGSKCGHAPRQTYLYKRGGAGKVQEREEKKKIKTQTKLNKKKKSHKESHSHVETHAQAQVCTQRAALSQLFS